MHRSLAPVVFIAVLAVLSSGCRRAAQSAEAPAAGAPAAGTPAPPPPPPAAPAYSGPVVEVPAGSRLMLRLEDNVDSKSGAGLRFSASLEGALLDANGRPIVPAGTKVF